MHMNTFSPVFDTDPQPRHRLALLLLRLLEHLLHDLLLLNQESADDAVLDAVGASRTTVRTLDGLLGAADGCVFTGTEGGDASKLGAAVLRPISELPPHFPICHLHRTWGQYPSS